MDIDYALQELSLAIDGAITSEEPVQTRLRFAMISHIHELERNDFPNEDLWDRVERLRHATSSKPSTGAESTTEVTTAQMTTDEARNLLHEISSILIEVARECGRQDRANSARA